MDPRESQLLASATEVICAYIRSHADLPLSGVIDAIHQVRAAFGAQRISTTAVAGEPLRILTPKEMKDSITAEYLISFEDGKSYRTLKRHLAGRGLTPAQYRAKWGLPDNYPMTAPAYSLCRSELARANGLGVKES